MNLISLTNQPMTFIADLVGSQHWVPQDVVMVFLRSPLLWSEPAPGLGPKNSDPSPVFFVVKCSDDCFGNDRVIFNR